MATNARILVVDDSIDIRELLQMLLEDAGYQVMAAEDGVQGFDLARRWRPDLVLLDVVMPRMDGLELLLKLRSDLTPPIPPVILCSGFDLTEEEALRRGAARFLRKPLNFENLSEAVRDTLAGRAVAPARVRGQREHASAARQRVLDAARDFVRRIEAHGASSLAELERRALAKVTTLAAYTGIARAAMAIVHEDKLIVLAASGEAALAFGFDLGRALPEAYEVLETGSALLLPDASVHPFSSVSRALGGIRFFAGMPFLLDGGIPVGMICLFDTQARRVEPDDLVALHLFGRRGSDVLLRFSESGAAVRAIPHGPGIVPAALFEALLDAELRILASSGGSMEIAIVDAQDREAVSQAIEQAPARERLLAGVLPGARLGIFKRSTDGSAGPQLAAVIGALRARGAVHEAGVVDLLGHGVRGFGARDLVYVGGIELDRAVERGDRLRRIVIEERST